MSALGIPVLINANRSYWLSSIGNDVLHSTIKVQEIDADIANISTANISTLNATDLQFRTLDLSGLTVSSIAGNTAVLSTLFLQSGDGVNPFLRFTVDPSGVQVDGCPIRFDNLVYLTSTINIVQVSTLVDTDLFASNGYFSTLSSGTFTAGSGNISSLVFNDMSGNTGSMKQLTVSSIVTTDISGVALAEKWSLFQTLNSSITFQPGFVLSNIGPTLYFSGVEITDVSGGGQYWSRFPAASTVQFANNSAIGLSTLQFQDGGKLYSLTGNNLFYNNNQINTGAAGAASNWAAYPANQNVNMNTSTLSNAFLLQSSNLNLTGSNITNGNTFTNSLGVGGLSTLPVASITSGGDLSVRNIEVGDSTTSLADVNIYGALAVPGDNALYVIGGTTLTGGLTLGVPVHGTEIGAAPVAGIDTMRIDVLPAGVGINAATYVQVAAAGAGSFAAGGALSLAGGDYVEINTDDCRIINTTSGNQSTTLTVANIQMPGSVAASVPLQINNTAGGGINLVGTAGVGQIAGFSSIYGDRLISPFMSTININLSTINGVDWQDISGSVYTTTSSFNQLFTSSLRVSTLVGYSFPGGAIPVSTVRVEGGFQFTGDYQGNAQSGRFLSSVRNINSDGEWLRIIGGGSNKEFSLFYNDNAGGNTEYVRVGGGSFFDTKIRNYLGGGGAVSTSHILTSSIIGDPIGGLDISGNVQVTGGMFLNNTLELPLATGGINFDDGSGSNYTRLMRRDVASANMLSVVNTPGLSSNNMMPLGVGEIFLTGGADQYAACRLYSVFPYGNYELDAIDENGTFLHAYLQGYYNPFGLNPGYTQAFSNVSSISGYDESSAPNQMVNIINGLTTSNLIVSSINGAAPGGGGSVTNQFSTLGTSSFTFSTATSIGSNTNFNYPIFIDYDQAGNTTTAGVAIAVQGHNLGAGAVVNRLEMGARATGENYIMSVWPGQNLEELFIDATDVTIRDGTFSTILNLDPFGLQTTGGIMGPFMSTLDLNVSSINGIDARSAYLNALMTSTMTLYTASTTLMSLDSNTTSSNINISGYDAVVGVNGTYKIGTSFQFISPGSADEVEFFVLKNNVPISYGGGICEVANNVEIIQYCEIVEPLLNGDAIQVGCYTNGTNVFVSTIVGTAIVSPAMILTMYKVD